MTSPKQSLADLDLERIRRFARARVPAHLANEIRLDVEVRGASVTLMESRPPWRPDYGPEWSHRPIAQLRYEPARQVWTLYWSRANGHWQRYDAIEPVSDVNALLAEMDEDPSAVFWG